MSSFYITHTHTRSRLFWKYNIGHVCHLFTVHTHTADTHTEHTHSTHTHAHTHTHTHTPDSSAHELSRQGNRSGVPLPALGDLPDAGTEPMPLAPPAVTGGFFATSATWEATGSRLRMF